MRALLRGLYHRRRRGVCQDTEVIQDTDISYTSIQALRRPHFFLVRNAEISIPLLLYLQAKY